MAHSTLLLLTLITPSNSQCNTSSSTLPAANHAFACGEHNGSIYLIGGYAINLQTQVTEYQIDQNTMINHGKLTITDETYGFGQFYTQIHSTLYMIANARFSIFNLETGDFVEDFFNMVSEANVFPINPYTNGCLASTPSFLFVVGGWNSNALNTVQVFDIQLKSWLSSNMIRARVDPACLVHDDRLYAIGGKDDSCIHLTSFESIDVATDITEELWEITGNLLYKASMLRCVSYSSLILCVGGGAECDGTFLNTIQFINTANGIVTEGDPLVIAVDTPAVIIVNGILYVFGGRNSENEQDIVQYCDLPSIETSSPTETTLHSTAQPSTAEPSTAIPTTTSLIATDNPSENTLQTTEERITTVFPNVTVTSYKSYISSLSSSDAINTVNIDISVDGADDITLPIVLVFSSISLLTIIGVVICYWKQRKNEKQIFENMNNDKDVDDVTDVKDNVPKRKDSIESMYDNNNKRVIDETAGDCTRTDMDKDDAIENAEGEGEQRKNIRIQPKQKLLDEVEGNMGDNIVKYGQDTVNDNIVIDRTEISGTKNVVSEKVKTRGVNIDKNDIYWHDAPDT